MLSKVRHLLLDIDGTIVLGGEATRGAKQFLRAIGESGRSFLVVTNNNSISLDEHAERLRGAGLKIGAGDIMSSAEVAGEFLSQEWKCQKVMVLGAAALRKALEAAGMALTDKKPEAVVVGFDTELAYKRLKQACFLIQAGCRWLATHPDVAMPAAEGYWPDCGAITAAIVATTGREPNVVLGKPSEYMGRAVIRRSGFEAGEIMMVGDRAETDVLFAKVNGMLSALVLGGATKAEEAHEAGADLVCKDLGELVGMFLDNRLEG